MVSTYRCQVRTHGGEMRWGDFFDSLEFDDYLMFDEPIEPVQSHLNTLVDSRHSKLASESNSAILKLHYRRVLVDRFQKPWAKLPVDRC